ncbi:MAG: multiubiquitin domain-containing protein [Gordonibacter sp.]|nr:multiubiquitin domain-containing protein [Gordonibacter sp.]
MEDENSKKPKKDITVIINGREAVVPHEKITFERIIELAFGSYDPDPAIAYTVGYSKGEDKKPKGVLLKGQSVMVKNGMIFNVSKTNRS